MFLTLKHKWFTPIYILCKDGNLVPKCVLKATKFIESPFPIFNDLSQRVRKFQAVISSFTSFSEVRVRARQCGYSYVLFTAYRLRRSDRNNYHLLGHVPQPGIIYGFIINTGEICPYSLNMLSFMHIVSANLRPGVNFSLCYNCQNVFAPWWTDLRFYDCLKLVRHWKTLETLYFSLSVWDEHVYIFSFLLTNPKKGKNWLSIAC